MSAFYDKILDIESRGQVYVIAEVGSNWKTRDDLMGSITLAKACGADAVKFQYFTESELYGPVPEIDKTFPLFHLREKCDAVGIDFLCSTFSPAGMDEADKFLKAHKIASSEMSHLRLLEAVKATGKPVILSTGAFGPADIAKAVDVLKGSELILMHANLSYPTKYTDLKKFDQLRANFTGPMGYSDHTTNIDLVASVFKDRGICVYEKHFNPFEYTSTPDAPHSLKRDEFRAMVSYLRGQPNDFNEENEGRLKHIRRVVALKDIRPGDRLVEGENVGIFRVKEADQRGISPFNIDRILGRAATKVVERGRGVGLIDTV